MSHRTIEDRYRSRVDRRSQHECWPWTGALDAEGYGVILHETRKCRAHRIGWMLHKSEPLPDVVRHTCDTPACQNPDHWVGGTQLDNVADREARRRTATGTRNGRARLTPELVRTARAQVSAGRSVYSLAPELGISRNALLCAVKGVTWRNV